MVGREIATEWKILSQGLIRGSRALLICRGLTWLSTGCSRTPALPTPAQVSSDPDLLHTIALPPSPSPNPSTVSRLHGTMATERNSGGGLGMESLPTRIRFFHQQSWKLPPLPERRSGETVSERAGSLLSDWREGYLLLVRPGAEVVENAWESGPGWDHRSCGPN